MASGQPKLSIKAVNNHVKKILFIAGTRPEAIKLAPVYLEMKGREGFAPVMCSTGQHADLVSHGFGAFGIMPDIMLETMVAGQGLHQLTGALFQQVGEVVREQRPDAVVVQGDTVSAFAGGWCGFYQKVPVVHVEAGLRTGNLEHPFPEEAVRRALTVVADVHMAPTGAARENLLREGVAEEKIVVTGNTTIDALYLVMKRHEGGDGGAGEAGVEAGNHRHILVTGHRRENFGEGLENLCYALLELAQRFPDVVISYAVHPNPAVKEPVYRMLGAVENIRLLPPLEYGDFVKMMARSVLIISDSGGVQEEAPALGVPVLITRETTERPEAVTGGANLLVGAKTETIVEAAARLLTHPEAYDRMARAGCPYGDGKAAKRICDYLEGLPVEEFAGGGGEVRGEGGAVRE